MGNRVEIFLTRFATLDLQGNEVESNYGVRVCDDNAQSYMAGLTRDELVGKTPAEILELVRGIDADAADMISFAENTADGIHIGETFFSWDELKGGPKP